MIQKLILTLILSINISFGATLSQQYIFGDPEVIKENKVVQINLDNLPQSINPGMPILPFKTAKILLEDNIKVKRITVRRLKTRSINGVNSVGVSETIYPYSAVKSALKNQRKRILFSDLDLSGIYPSTKSYHSVQKHYGFQILHVNIHPIYIVDGKNFFYSKRIVVDIDFDYVPVKENRYKKINRIGEVMRYVDNPVPYKILEENYNANNYDYLILSSKDLISYRGQNSLHAYKSFIEERLGLKVKIVDVKEALNSRRGRDSAESLRNYIQDQYITYSIKYLLLAADSDGRYPVIPVRKFYTEIMGYNGSWNKIKENINSDFYYSCLDGSFNGDGDSRWGEINDGEAGGDVDFLCELTVGRWSVDDSRELQVMVKKTLKGYDSNQREKNVLLLGEELFSEMNLWGKHYMDKLVGEIFDHGYKTVGYDSSWYISRMYDKDGGWNGSALKRKISSGNYLMINHLGHSNKSYGLRLYSFSFRGFENVKPFFLYTQGCFSGDYTTDSSIIEKMLTSRGGPFAAVANTNYGLGPEDPDASSTSTPGTSQILHRFFINRVLGENRFKYGEAHRKSKEDLLIYIQHQEARWVTWAATYFGDPVLR